MKPNVRPPGSNQAYRPSLKPRSRYMLPSLDEDLTIQIVGCVHVIVNLNNLLANSEGTD